MTLALVPAGPKSKARHSIGVAMAGGNPKAGRHEHDFYATPPAATVALARRLAVDEFAFLKGPIWEPFCGDGAIANVLEGLGFPVIGTDLVDRGYGGHGGGHDILQSRGLLADEIVTNPPFDVAEEVIEHLIPMRPRVLALLLKSTFWNAARRRKLFMKHRPMAVYALSWRPDFAGKKRPTMECSWNVWRHGHNGPTEFDILERPQEFAPARIRTGRTRRLDLP